jgi:dihydrofolate reductase
MADSRVRVYIACSLDGFIAGPDDDLSWLPGTDGEGPPQATEPGALGFEEFMADVGAMLMGRRTFDVVTQMSVPWAYGDIPVFVPTHRPLETTLTTVHLVHGDIGELVASAKDAAGGKDVYVDGGDIIRQALDADLIDELVVTIVPVVLGRGHALFAGAKRQHQLQFVSHHTFAATMVQLHLTRAA